MGFFSLSATCAICGKKVGLNRYKIGLDASGNEMWKCPACARKGGSIELDRIAGKARFYDPGEGLQYKHEYRMKCSLCGNIFCYTDADMARNAELAKSARTDAVLGVAEAIGGTRIGSQLATDSAERKLGRIVDYNRCPRCGSYDLKELTDEEWEAETKASAQSVQTPAVVSAADEIRKFKELLDSGIITQEEFDAKKKQLLGL